MAEAQAATKAHSCKLMICFGGNGRSQGFSPMVRNPKARKGFVRELSKFISKHNLDGVDYNWEYPGYDFRRGYLPEAEIQADYQGLADLVRDTRDALPEATITMAYYPDTRQEALLKQYGLVDTIDLFHSMAYDQGGKHSTRDFSQKVMSQVHGVLPAHKVTLGVPFYARSMRTGEWKSYEDLVQQEALKPDQDEAGEWYFNGPGTIAWKTEQAVARGLAGVMIWEVGQDCRMVEVRHGADTHVVTCPGGPLDSLLTAIQTGLGNAARTEL
mmetsp:Transcript_84719/g.226479  ORF Transcript_84719/g.226479 Transcript_84719/m.226479 type:complete len:271 (+) Transcript_84719:188-1000(+)